MRAASIPSILPFLAATISGAAAADSWSTIPAIRGYGQHFFYTNNGTQFLMKGVAYQQNYNPNGTSSATVDYSDPLADAAGCARDIPAMQELFTNTIRVYAVDPTQSHDSCMSALATAGIYVVIDLSEPSTSIDSNDPEWNVPLYQRYTSVIDAFAKYNNVIGFFAGNEVISSQNQTASAAFVKAAVRDSKAYIKSQGYRNTLGIGYATADVPSRDQIAYYFACEPTGDNSTSIDFWGYNVYSWCGDSNYVSSSYDTRVDFFSTFPVPAFFAEYGCNQVVGGGKNRPFTEVAVLYGNMTSVFSGGIVYEWFQETNDFGLVSISGSSIVTKYPAFTSLKSQLAKVSPSLTQMASYTPTNSAPACPTVDTTSWAAQSSPLPPAVNPQYCACLVDTFSCNINSNDSTSYGSVFNFICGANSKYCDGFAHNATTGTYGAVAGCSPQQQLAYAANQYYIGQSSASDACSFSGLAATQAATTPSTCASILSVVGTAGTGTVPAATGSQGVTTGGAASSSSKAAAPGTHGTPLFFNFGGFYLGAYIVLAVASAAGMVLL